MRALVTKLYLFCFFDDFLLIYPLYAVLFAESGLSVGQISLLFGVWSVVATALTVPFGVLADRVSRRGILVASQFVKSVGFLFWIIEPSFLGFFAGFVLWGASSAMSEGTFEALAYDELEELGHSDAYVKFAGRAEGIALAAVVAASLGASVAIDLGFTFVLVLSIASVLLAGVFVVLLPESQRRRQIHRQGYLKTLRSGAGLALRDGYVLRIILFAGFIGAIWGSLDEYWSLYLKDLDFSRPEISLGMAFFALAGAIGSFSAHRFEHLSNRTFLLLMAALGALLLGAVGLDAAPSVVLIAAFTLGFALIQIVLGGRLQHAIEGRTRATVTSVAGVVAELMGLGVFALVGILAAPYGLKGGLLVVGALILVVAIASRSVDRIAPVGESGRRAIRIWKRPRRPLDL